MAFVTLLCLAVGIGANTAIFSVIKGVLLDPLAFHEPDRLVCLWEQKQGEQQRWYVASPANFSDWKDQSDAFAEMAAYQFSVVNLTNIDNPRRLRIAYTTEDFFTTLGVEPTIGRTFSRDEHIPGENHVAVLTEHFWREQYGADPELIGKTIEINAAPYVVVGVMPPKLEYPLDIELWIPSTISSADIPRGGRFLSVIARLAPGVTLEQAESEMSVIAQRLERDYPEANAGFTVGMSPLADRLLGTVRPMLLLLLAGVGFVLLVACANVANLLLARAVAREAEISARVALGASRRDLIRQLLTESLVLAVLGGVLGLILADLGMRLILLGSPDQITQLIPRLHEIGLDREVLAFAAGISLLVGVVAGLVPALFSSKPDIANSLKSRAAMSAAGVRGRRSLGLLVAAEVTLSLVLLIGTGLMLKSFLRLQRVDPGFDTENVLKLDLFLPRQKYSERSQLVAFYDAVLERLRTLPGVVTAGGVAYLPLSGNSESHRFAIEGQPQPPGEEPLAQTNGVSAGYFQAMGISVLRGRSFSTQDTADSPGVAIVNQSLAEHFWPGSDPVGQRIRWVRSRDPQPPWITVVGVVGDVKHVALTDAATNQIYVPYTQIPDYSMSFLLRTMVPPMTLAEAARKEIQRIDPDQPVSRIMSLDEHFGDSLARRRFITSLLGILAALALFLATAGIYGVMSYSVNRRVQEMGIRMTLGARPTGLIGMVVRQGMKLVLVGIVTGLVIAFFTTRWLASQLYQVGALDPLTFGLVPLILLAIALLASYLPARRAACVDPVSALRGG